MSSGTVNTPYPETTFTASGGTPPYTLVQSGTLPKFMSFAGGKLSGTPTEIGTFDFTITASDVNGCEGGQPYNLVIDCPTISVQGPATLSAAVLNAPYPATAFSATGGVGTHSLTVSAGQLPKFMTLGPNGVLSGTPQETGTFPFTIKATDENGCAGTRSFTLVVNVGPRTYTSPEGAFGKIGRAHV